MNYFNIILEDLKRDEPHHVSILPSISNNNDDNFLKIKSLLRQLQRAKFMNNRREILLIVWYIGDLVENSTESSSERSRCLQLLSSYYRRNVIKIYYLFEMIGIEQIMRTKDITLTMIS